MNEMEESEMETVVVDSNPESDSLLAPLENTSIMYPLENEIELETVVVDSNPDNDSLLGSSENIILHSLDENESELVVDSNPDNDSLIAAAEKTGTNFEEMNKMEKLVRLPLTRIKNIVKMDPDVSICSKEALLLISKSTEFLVECLSKEAYSYTVSAKRKTVQKRDVEQAIDSVDALAFLEGVLDS